MACGCQGGATGEQWEVVYADGTVSHSMTHAEATAWSNQVGGSWIREKATASAAK
jgi:hypothetical protein